MTRGAITAIALACAALFAAPAFSAPVTVQWVYSTKCSDGSALVNCPVTSVQINQRADATTPVLKSVTLPPASTSTVFDLPPGKVCFSGIVFSNLAQSIESPVTPAACAVVPNGIPGALVITITIAVAPP